MLLLLSPAIFAQNYKNSDPNNEPFLPIYPVYPYSPKLIKRGTERDVATPGSQDSYLQKQDIRDSYASNFGGNFPREQYNYNSFSKTPSPSQNSPFSSVFPSSPFGSSPFGSSPFGPSPFGPNPFGSSPFNAGSFNLNPYNSQNSFSGYQNTPLTQPPQQSFSPNTYPNFYQPPVFVPNFYNQYPPSVPPPGADYDRNNDEDDGDDRKSKKGGKAKYKESDNEDLNDSQFTDGANYLSSNIKDLDGQSTTHKESGIYKSPQSKLPFKLIGIAGQSASLDYPSTAYIKPQQLENFMRQTLIKLLAQNVAQQASQTSQPSQIQYPVYESNPNIQNSPDQGTVNKDGQSYVSVPNIIAKTGLSYVVNPLVINKSNNQVSPGQTQQTQAIIGKNPRYADSQYQKPPGLFPLVKANRNQSPDYTDFVAQPSQVEQNFQTSEDQDQKQRTNHKSQNLVTPTPQSSSYHFPGYQPTPVPKSDQRNLDNISLNFGSKQKGK